MLKERIFFIPLLLGVALSGCGGGGTGTPPTAGQGATTAAKTIGTGTFNANTYLLKPAETLNSVITDTTLTLKKPQSQIRKVGDVLIIEDHDGRLLEVTGVSETAGEVVYTYKPASLAKAFNTLDVSLKENIGPDDLGDTLVTNDPELELSWAPVTSGKATGKDVALERSIDVKYKNIGINSGISMSGSSSFAINPEFKITLTRRGATPDLDMTALISPKFTTQVKTETKYGGSIAWEMPTKEYKFKSFKRYVMVPVFGVPMPVPIIIKPVLTVDASVNGTANSMITAQATTSIGGSFGFRKNYAGVENIYATQNSHTLDVTDAQGAVNLSVAAPQVSLSFMLYSVAGPHFDLGAESSLEGSHDVQSGVEGIKVTGKIGAAAAAGLKVSLDFSSLEKISPIFGELSTDFSPFKISYTKDLASKEWFFPYIGTASIVVRDNGNAPDDIFAIYLDGVLLGNTTKGGSGQFRLKNLKPGSRQLSVKVVEDDAPPGTYEVQLADGLKFNDGQTIKSGTAALGQQVDFTIVVPN